MAQYVKTTVRVYGEYVGFCTLLGAGFGGIICGAEEIHNNNKNIKLISVPTEMAKGALNVGFFGFLFGITSPVMVPKYIYDRITKEKKIWPSV